MKTIILISGLITTIFSSALQAQSIYVSDQLEAALRRGEGLEYKVIRMLRSGEKLSVISQNTTGYTKVKTSNGKTGFILTRYLMQNAAARTLVNDFEAENLKLKSAMSDMEKELSDMTVTLQEQSTKIDVLQTTKGQVDSELADIREATADVLAIKQKNTALEKELASLTADKDSLLNENNAYRNNTQQDWFLRGAGVVLVGVFIGLVLPKMGRRRRWGEL